MVKFWILNLITKPTNLMESFGHKMFISSQPVPLTGTGVLYPRFRDFFVPKLVMWILKIQAVILNLILALIDFCVSRVPGDWLYWSQLQIWYLIIPIFHDDIQPSICVILIIIIGYYNISDITYHISGPNTATYPVLLARSKVSGCMC